MTDQAGSEPTGSEARPADDAAARPSDARSAWREVWSYDALALLALSGLAVAQPLLDLFGKNPEFFVAADATRPQIVVFGLVVAFGVALVGILLEVVAHAIDHRVGWIVHAVLVGVLGVALGATVARQFDFTTTLPVLLVSFGIGGLILVGEQRTRAVQLGLRYLSIAPVLFLALFVFTSGTSRLLWEDEAEAATGVHVGNPKPVVVVVFDELPIASLMTEDGTINADRFPNFARLADEGTWFRNASSLSPNTPGSVPTVSSGLHPQSGSLPTSIDYPRNLFTLLAGSYEMDVTETITELCPSSLCVEVEDPGQPSGGFVARLRQSLSDASVVYGHVALPPTLREDLPAVDQSWGGFIDGADASAGISGPSTAADDSPPSTAQGIDEFMQERNEEMRANGPIGRGELMRAMTNRIGDEPESRLYFVHDGLMPHFNWVMTPDAQVYAGAPGPPGSREGEWGQNDFLIRQGQQRHLLQVGYADALLGQTIDRLTEQGIWDDALVVVTADHGIAFTAGEPKRTPTDENVEEIYRVPLFVKLPGQVEGVTRDDNAVLSDILPTIVDVLEIDTDWDFDGRSLVGDEPVPDAKPVFYGSGPSSVPPSLDGLYEVVERNAERFPNGDGWRGVAAVGRLGHLVGRDVEELEVSAHPTATWSAAEEEVFADVGGGLIPLVVHGRLRLGGGAEPPDEALIAVDGTVAGVAGNFDRNEGRWGFRALLDFRVFTEGDHTLTLLLPRGDARTPAFREVPLA